MPTYLLMVEYTDGSRGMFQVSADSAIGAARQHHAGNLDDPIERIDSTPIQIQGNEVMIGTTWSFTVVTKPELVAFRPGG